MIKTSIRGKDIPEDEIRDWEQEKTEQMSRYLSRRTGYVCSARSADELAH